MSELATCDSCEYVEGGYCAALKLTIYTHVYYNIFQVFAREGSRKAQSEKCLEIKVELT